VLLASLATTGLLWSVPVILNVGVSLSDRSPGGDKNVLCMLVGLEEWARCGRTWEVRLVLPPPRVASWDA
jgi:hypothetical protein